MSREVFAIRLKLKDRVGVACAFFTLYSLKDASVLLVLCITLALDGHQKVLCEE